MNPWHDIPLGEDAPDRFTAVVEVPLDSRIKYELDKDLGLIRISHALYPPVPYPGNYGFAPGTLDEDGDPLDLLVVMRDAVPPLTLVTVRPVGVVHMEDEGLRDDKLVCVMVPDPIYDGVEDFDELPDYERRTLTWFFEEYQDVTHDAVEVSGVSGAEEARRMLVECRDRYRDILGVRN